MIDEPFVVFLNTYGVFLLFLLVLWYLWFREKSREEAIHILLSAFVAGALTLILKELFSIPRPYVSYGLEPLAGFSVRTSSLPSLHTALAFSLATTVALHQRRFGIFLLVIAALIGFGRIAANVHYPLDIAFGAVVGTITSLFIENPRIPPHRKRAN